jgi:RNA polymerase sigma factor (sigma-70 family)
MAPLLARRPAADRAFERIYRRHVGDVYRYTLAVLRDPHDAEDVTQTTFMNAYRAFQNGERPQTPKNWLIAIAHNVCRQRFRQAQRRPQEAPLFEDAAEMAVEEPEQEYTADDIQRALGHLAFNQRAALVMRELEGRSYAEIAEIMGLTVGAVETLIFRGRRALREQLEGTLTCHEAELALSKQADGMLQRAERGQLRAHLRECKECAALARRHRATRTALKALGAIPLPSSLIGLFGGGSAVGLGLAAKAAVVVAAGVVVGGAGYEGARHVDLGHPKTVAATKAKLPVKAAPTKIVPAVPKERVKLSPATPVKALPHASAAKAKARAEAKTVHVANGPKPAKKPKKHDVPAAGVGVGVGVGAHPAKVHHEPTNPVKRPKHEPMNPVKRVSKPKVKQAHKPIAVHQAKTNVKPAHPERPQTPAPPHPEKKPGKSAEAPATPVPTVSTPTETTPTTTVEHGPLTPPGSRGPKK